jgi:hypothetical protein
MSKKKKYPVSFGASLVRPQASPLQNNNNIKKKVNKIQLKFTQSL